MSGRTLAGGNAFALVKPSLAHLPGYADALRRGWSANTAMNTSAQELAQIEADPVAFVAGKVDREAKGPPVELPDGSHVARLPGVIHWIWNMQDDCFAGSFASSSASAREAAPRPRCHGTTA